MVIDGKKTIIEEQIEMLIQWSKEYPKVPIMSLTENRFIEQYPSESYEVIKKISTIVKIYTNIRALKSKGKLTEEQILSCKEGNVRGIFGYPKRIEELARICGLGEKDIDYIINNYVTIDNFKDLYRTGQLSKEDLLLAESIFRKVIDIDFVSSNRNYDNLFIGIFADIIKDKGVVLYSSKILEELLGKLDERERTVLERRFEKSDTLEAIGKDLGLSREAIRRIECSAKRKIIYDFAYTVYYDLENCCKEGLTPQEESIIIGLKDDIYSSPLIFANISYDSYKKMKMDDKRDDIIKALEFIKNMDEILKKRSTQEDLIKELMDTTIEKLGLSRRTYTCLARGGVHTVKEMLEKYEQKSFMKIRGIGSGCMEEIESKIREIESKITEYVMDGLRRQENVKDDTRSVWPENLENFPQNPHSFSEN